MANKRISELQPITADQLTTADLLLLADVESIESKKLTLLELSKFLSSNGNFTSGAFHGTASWADWAVNTYTASYVSIQPTASYAKSSSWATNVDTSSYALLALSSSFSKSGSYAFTASYALITNAILATSAAYATNARTASYLLYTAGRMNGTASFAISASNSKTASFALNANNAAIATFALNGGVVTGGSYKINTLWASQSKESLNSTSSLTSSYLLYNGLPNGTASYAITSKTPPTVRINHGIFKGIVQSNTASVIDNITFTSTIDGYYSSSICAVGSVNLPATSAGAITLLALDKWSGITQTLDATNVSSTIGSGNLQIPFTLMGEGPMSSSQFVYVLLSGGITLDTSKVVKYNVTSFADTVKYSPGELMSFQTYPTAAIMTYTSSAYPGTVRSGAYTDMIVDGISTITEINANGIISTKLKYVYSLTNLTKLKCATSTLIDIGGMPPSLTELYCNNCSLVKIAPLNNTSLTRIDCMGNNITILPNLPSTTTYINCSSNLLLNSIIYSFPVSLTHFDCHHTILTKIPSLLSCPGILYVDVSNCNMTSTAIEIICSQLVTNGLSNGILNVSLNNGYTGPTAGYITTLQGLGWTVTI